MTFANREIALTVSIGIALFDPQWHPKREDMLKDAEIAMRYAKRDGGGRIEVFRPSMRSQALQPPGAGERLAPRARPRRNQSLLPADRAARGPHRRRVRDPAALAPSAPRPHRAGEFIPLAEETGLIVDLGLFALQRTAARTGGLAAGARSSTPPIFATVNVSSRQMLRHDLLADVKDVLTRSCNVAAAIRSSWS